MMNKICLAIIFLLLTSVGSLAQSAKTAPKVGFRSLGLGKVSVSKGTLRSTIDLTEMVAGCAFVEAKYKRSLNAKGCAAPTASFKLIDATVKNNQTFLVVLSNAMGNCNVCGHCGASEAFTIIWLKLNDSLRVLDKKSVPIEFCVTNTSIVSPSINVNENDQKANLNLSLKNDGLQIDFEKASFVENSDRMTYEFSRLEYNRREPEKGFIIKTEKRPKSAIDN